jgi:hypothetical protein
VVFLWVKMRVIRGKMGIDLMGGIIVQVTVNRGFDGDLVGRIIEGKIGGF